MHKLGQGVVLHGRGLGTIGVLAVVLLSVLTAFAAPRVEQWTQVRNDDGVTTWKGQRPGPLPVFRSRAIVEANLFRIVAVLEDVDRGPQWTANCAEMRKVAQLSDHEMMVYARMDSPWPVDDRDVVTRVRADFSQEGEVLVHIRGQAWKSEPRRDGVVRMPWFIASYRFRALGPERTEVTYEADVDPGGSLPDWLKRRIASEFPHDTLSRLRARVRWARKEGRYVAAAKRLAEVAADAGFVAATLEAGGGGEGRALTAPRR